MALYLANQTEANDIFHIFNLIPIYYYNPHVRLKICLVCQIQKYTVTFTSLVWRGGGHCLNNGMDYLKINIQHQIILTSSYLSYQFIHMSHSLSLFNCLIIETQSMAHATFLDMT